MPLSELNRKIQAEARAQSPLERGRKFDSRSGTASAIVSDAAPREPQPGLAVALRGAALSTIAETIERDWKNVNYAARPYLDALHALDNIVQNYGADSGKAVVAYFLANASTWRGPVARIVKAELRHRGK